MEASEKINIDLPYDPAILLLGIYLNKCDSGYYKKQPRCPSTNEWIKKMWYLYTMDFYSATKNKILSFASKWMDWRTLS
jgi:hypothetical protein